MKQTLSHILSLGFLITFCIGLSGCGQKGPIVVEQPEIDLVTTQKEELEETK